MLLIVVVVVVSVGRSRLAGSRLADLVWQTSFGRVPPNEVRQTRSAKRGPPNEVRQTRLHVLFCIVAGGDFFDLQGCEGLHLQVSGGGQGSW